MIRGFATINGKLWAGRSVSGRPGRAAVNRISLRVVGRRGRGRHDMTTGGDCSERGISLRDASFHPPTELIVVSRPVPYTAAAEQSLWVTNPASVVAI